jgi:NAD(P)-dependent dehydrogenase (short-subunit alcohol dehydrogenase family)
MKIIIVGASGAIGKKVTAALKEKHEIITVGRNSGDIRADITSSDSLDSMFKEAGAFDALVSTSGSGHFGPLKTMTAEQFKMGLHNKLLGQVDLVLIGQHYINEGGSFTLTSGVLSDDPVYGGANLSAINAAINSFVMAAAAEVDKRIRINAVSPGVVEDSPELFPAFPGHIPVPMDRVVAAYIKSVESPLNGQVIKVF